MKVCIVGAGAIGGWIGTRLAAAGRAEVSALARGATLAALQAHGWRLNTGGELLRAPVRAAEHAGELGEQDLVVIAVKGPALASVAQGLKPLLGPNTIVLPAMNGVPWWFCEGIEAVGPGPLRSVDPQGEIGRCVAPHRVVGCVVHASAFTPEPGVVTHVHGRNLVIGEPAGGSSERVQRLNELLSHAGFDVTVSGDVRLAIWFKLLGNMTMNPVSALTGATMDRMLADPLVRNFCSAVMLEAADIGERIGCKVEATPEDRHAVTAKLGAVKTSMLQDAEAGRPLELDAIVSAVHEIGQRLGRSTPHLDALLGLTRLNAQVRGLYPQLAS